MTVISSDLEKPTTDTGPDKLRHRRSRQSVRRKRSILWTIRRLVNQILRSRLIYHAGFVLLLLAGFIHVSLMNDVLGLNGKASNSNVHERSAVTSNAESGTLQPPSFALDPSDNRFADAPIPTRLASAWTTSDLGLSRMAAPDRADGAPPDPANGEPLTSDTAETGRSFSGTTSYVVNEGGSLWRTGKRFIDDEVLLDKLIDNLEESGMDVRNVRPGVEFIVNDLGSEGLHVIVDDGGDTYESHILEDSVTISVQRQAEVELGVDSTRTASLSQ